ncbi:endonuclease/exonuclease/phosphatase family protein [Calidifontibacter indicus]|uniref:Endonuclease/exonuclease/phosphatase family metal-dependent hydrolase n=1 Tax=Calidifontibacter indicus TaxID=419650 RepID=A0A3D9UPP9_9MICO|nr:endonuclease/exonuclease/phosphatase family protein [Calidifontibacter indicus]REF31428.1 endonuclease/exonuclease/phosphatase family metal-dependent hydrolase [Calidifontibacter indicus]
MSEVRPGHVLRVVSYNVRAFKDDTDALVDLVRMMDPDVLLVQEAPRHPFAGHRIARFAQQCGLTWSDGKRGWMSTTLLTSLRVHLHDCVHRNLVVRKGDEPRGYALATVSLPGHRPVHVASLHMSLRSDERKLQADTVLGALQPDAMPAIIGGDLNETPGHDVWKLFGQTLHEATPDAFTFPSTGPVKRIDAIFASTSLPHSQPLFALDPAQLARATDHLPIYADFDLSSLAK